MRALAVVIALLSLLVFAFAEVLLASPIALWLYAGVVALFAAGVLRPAVPRLQRVVLVLFVAGAATLLFLVPWSSRKPFLHHLYSIRPGMSEAEARRIMSGYIVGTGWPANPFVADSGDAEFTIPSAIVFRHSSDGAFNSDWGIVYVRGGKVTRVEFNAD